VDQTQRQVMKEGPEPADETAQAPYLLTGGILLVAGGLILILQTNAGVADFGGGILALMGLALVAAALWLYSQRR
jgi:hypothetical protein